jgi:four helix bundle protein
MQLRPYEKLIAWQESHKLYLWIHKCTEAFPKNEQYRLLDQIRRACYSVPMNIAEGCNKRSLKERRRFYEIAASSLEELHYQCRLSHDLRYISSEDFLLVQNHIGRTSYLLNRMRGVIS